MNTQSINNLISKKVGLNKSTLVKGTAQVLNRQGICYAYRRTYKWSGEFHCEKSFGKYYYVYFDYPVSEQVKTSVADLLKKNGCTEISIYQDNIFFRIAEAENSEGKFKCNESTCESVGVKSISSNLNNFYLGAMVDLVIDGKATKRRVYDSKIDLFIVINNCKVFKYDFN